MIPPTSSIASAIALVSRRVAVAMVAVALAVPLALLGILSVRSPERRTATVVTDHRLLVNDQVSAWLRGHSAPDDVEHIPGARDQLVQYLSGAQAPRFVVVYQKPTDPGIDPDGVLAPILQWQYTPVATVGGYQILEHQ